MSRISNTSLFIVDVSACELGAVTPAVLRAAATASTCSTRSKCRHRWDASTPTSTEASSLHRRSGQGPRRRSPRTGWIHRDQARHEEGCAVLRRDRRPRARATSSSRPAPVASASSPPTSAIELRPVGPNICVPRGSTSTSAATTRRARARTSSTGRCGPTPTATASPATGCGSRRSASRHQDRRSAARRSAQRSAHGQGAPHHQGAAGEAYVSRPRTRRARWATTSSRRATSIPYRVKIRSASLQQHLDHALAPQGCLRARHHHDPGLAVLHPGRHRPVNERFPQRPRRARLLAADRSVSAGSRPCCSPRAPSCTFACSRWCRSCRAGSARLAGRPVRFAPAARRGRQVHPEGRHLPPQGRPLRLRMAPYRSWCSLSTFVLVVVVPGGSRRLVHRSRHSASSTSRWPCRRCRSRHPHGRLGFGLKYSLLGGLRAAGQLIAYELPLILAVVGVVIQAGTMSHATASSKPRPKARSSGWGGIGNPYILTQAVGVR